MELEHDFIETNGIKLRVVQAGPKSGAPVILLHGFPEFWYGWAQYTKRWLRFHEAAGHSLQKANDSFSPTFPTNQSASC
ncbi:MAG: hypothetical protein L6Q26_10170 [Anaerolineales bacterium]|nr:hypothetical protein [Anaerolineales bacterium]